MKKFTITTLVTLSLGLITLAWLSETGRLKRFLVLNSTPTPTSIEKKHNYLKKLQGKATEAAAFVQKNNFNDRICFFVDMSLGSNESRFFVYDLKKDTIRNAGLVTHGRCNEEWLEGRKYGNTVGCGCTSLGKYKIGYSYNGQFGLAFKLHGLDKTNDKAYARYVVLHAHECVPETEIEGDICQSDGCPTVSPGYLQQLRPIIKASDKPVLLWIFE